MSQNRKKVKKLQKQRKQKRQEIAQRREKSFRQRSEQVHDEALDDMMPLFGGLSTAPGQGTEELILLLIDTDDLADEPEMEGVLFDPMLATENLGKAAEKFGFSPEKMATLSQEKREEAQLEMLEECVKLLLTTEICQEILKRLDNLRLRLKKSGRKKETARLAALISFLREDKKHTSWPMIGLVQALVRRHIDLGFALVDVAVAAAPDGEDETDILDAKVMKKPGPLKKLKTLLKTPGLQEYLEQKAEKTWEEGISAIFAGDLNLHVYLEEEIEENYKILANVIGFENAETMAAAGSKWKLTDKKAKELFRQLEIYITKIFTPARLKQLRGGIDTIFKDPNYTEKWAPFLAMLKGNLEDKKAVEYEMKFFIAALLGEMRAIAKEETDRKSPPTSK